MLEIILGVIIFVFVIEVILIRRYLKKRKEKNSKRDVQERMKILKELQEEDNLLAFRQLFSNEGGRTK